MKIFQPCDSRILLIVGFVGENAVYEHHGINHDWKDNIRKNQTVNSVRAESVLIKAVISVTSSKSPHAMTAVSAAMRLIFFIVSSFLGNYDLFSVT